MQQKRWQHMAWQNADKRESTYNPRELEGGASVGGRDPGEISPKVSGVPEDLHPRRGGGGGIHTVDMSGGGVEALSGLTSNMGGSEGSGPGGSQTGGASDLGRGSGTMGTDSEGV
jgi:hypothetical protein